MNQNIESDSLDYEKILESMISNNKKEEEPVNEMARSKMDPSEFGVPSQKKFPLTDAEHVKSAIKFFNYVDNEHEEELAMNIRKAAKKYGVTIHVGKKNRLSKYCKPEEINESGVVLEAAEKLTYLKKNSKIVKRPDKCPKCGGNMGIYLAGEPICKCNDCGYVAGVVCYDQKEAKKQYAQENYNISGEEFDFIQEAETASGSEYMNLLKEASEISDASNRSNSLYSLIVVGMYRGVNENTLIDYSKLLDESHISDLDDELTMRDDSNYKNLAEMVEVLANTTHLHETVESINEFATQKIDPLDSSTVKAALETADAISDKKKRSTEIRKIIGHTVGALCAKIKYILGQLNLYDQEYKYDGYIKTLFPEYIESLETKDLYELMKTVEEHAFTTGMGKKSIADVINAANDDPDKDKNAYIIGLATSVRKDLSNIMYMMRDLYKKRRFKGGEIEEEAIDPKVKRFRESYKFFTGHDVPVKEEVVQEKARLIDDNPFNNDTYMTNLKFSTALFTNKVNVAINTRYKEDAEQQLPYIENCLKNVKKSYKAVMEKVAQELYDKYKNDHGGRVTREQFDKSFFKNQLQNPVVALRDDYGCVFTFTYSINQYIDGRVLTVYIKTDMDGNAAQYAYKVEKDTFLGIRNI